MQNQLVDIKKSERNRKKLFYYIASECLGYDLLWGLHWDWYKQLWGFKPTMLLAYRGSFKSSSCIILGIPFFLLFNPTANILLVRKTGGNAEDTLRAIRSVMESELYANVFEYINGRGSFQIDGRPRANSISLKSRSYKNVGTVDAVGIEQKITGSHYIRVCFDDVVDLTDRLSEIRRKNTKAKIDEIRVNILNKSHFGANYCIIGTCWHPDDAHSLILRKEKKKINFIKYTIYDALKDGKIDQKTIDTSKEKLTDAEFQCQYLLNVPTQDLYPLRHNYPLFEGIEKLYSGFMVWDVAYMQGGDYNAVSIGTVDKSDGSIMVFGRLFKMDFIVAVEEVVWLVNRFNVSIAFVDESAGSDSVSTLISKRTNELLGRDLPVYGCRSRVKKSERILKSFQGFIERIKFLKETDVEFISMVRDWSPSQSPNQKDDAPDCLAHLLFYLKEYKLLNFDFKPRLKNPISEFKKLFKNDFEKIISTNY